EHRELLKRFRLFGPPGIIFFDPQGRELDVRVVGFQNAERFGKALDDVFARSAGSAAQQASAGTPAAGAGPQAAPAGASPADAVAPSALLSQQLRGFDGEVGQNAVAAGTLEAQQ